MMHSTWCMPSRAHSLCFTWWGKKRFTTWVPDYLWKWQKRDFALNLCWSNSSLQWHQFKCDFFFMSLAAPQNTSLKTTAFAWRLGLLYLPSSASIHLARRGSTTTGRTISWPENSCSITLAFMTLKQRSKAQVNYRQPFVSAGLGGWRPTHGPYKCSL